MSDTSLGTLIKSALKKVAPGREIHAQDLQHVLHYLQGHPLNESTIQNAARVVIEESAKDDLRTFVQQSLKQFGPPGYKVDREDVEDVIRLGKLTPKSNISTVRNAARKFLTTPKKLVDVPLEDIRQWVRDELERYGKVDTKEVNQIVRAYMDSTDPDSLVLRSDIRALVKKRKPIRTTAAPRPSDSREITPVQVAGKTPEPPQKGTRAKTFFDKIRVKMDRYGLTPLTREARSWLTDTVQKAAKVPTTRELFEKQKLHQSIGEALIGKMFLFAYDAKHKDTLPYWDAFPLIFVVEVYEDGWLGINLHYLPMSLRVKLFDALLTLADDTRLDHITRLRMSYQILKSFSQFPLVRPCIKRYLSTHVDSSLMEVPSKDFEIAIFLPVQKFQKKSAETVWRESRKLINKYS